MMRLPHQENNPEGLDACFVGIPMDIGCSNRSGTRHGPRAIRQESTMQRPVNLTGAAPFESLNVADIGDVPINTYDIKKTMDIITQHYRRILEANCIPLTLGGDHTLTLPILRAMKEKHGPVGFIQVDAHTDLHDTMFGEKIAHGTPFYRALEEGLISPKHMVQIGLRGSVFVSDISDEFEWAQKQVSKEAIVVTGLSCTKWHPRPMLASPPLLVWPQNNVGQSPLASLAPEQCWPVPPC